MHDLKAALEDIIVTEAMKAEFNNFYALGKSGEPMWDKPLVGFASGGDEYFKFWKADIGEFFWSPSEAYNLKYKEAVRKDEDLTVISIVFPQTEATKTEQSKAEKRPCLRWSATRGEWETYIQSVCQNILAKMENNGINAVAIDLLPEISDQDSPKYGFASNWSHRHAAFVAGIGTFGLSDGLITKHGKAVRFSTLIIDKRIEADRRPYAGYHEWCLYYANGTCGKCIVRCPVNAISPAGHDKKLCKAYLAHLLKSVSPEIVSEDKSHYYGCGLCQSRVPCQDGIPEATIASE